MLSQIQTSKMKTMKKFLRKKVIKVNRGKRREDLKRRIPNKRKSRLRID